jgi:hypothetical protein
VFLIGWLRPGWGAVTTIALVAILIVGAAYPLNMLRLRERYFFIGQYVGALDSPFFRYLARKPVAVPKGTAATR